MPGLPAHLVQELAVGTVKMSGEGIMGICIVCPKTDFNIPPIKIFQTSLDDDLFSKAKACTLQLQKGFDITCKTFTCRPFIL